MVSRIREFWLASGRTRADNDESVALGVARTGRVVTAAALVMSISFAALIAAHVSFMRMFGVGLTLAVIVDATLVRMVLLPAFMHVLGTWCWWAPKSLARLHERFGISDGRAVRTAQQKRGRHRISGRQWRRQGTHFKKGEDHDKNHGRQRFSCSQRRQCDSWCARRTASASLCPVRDHRGACRVPGFRTFRGHAPETACQFQGQQPLPGTASRAIRDADRLRRRERHLY